MKKKVTNPYKQMWDELHPYKEKLTGKNHISLGAVIWGLQQKYFPKVKEETHD